MTNHFYRIPAHVGPGEMSEIYAQLAKYILSHTPVNRNEWQGEISSNDQMKTFEIANAIVNYQPTSLAHIESHVLGADMPWAEAHFQERVSGIPHNPPPSAEDWPWHQGAKKKFTDVMTGEFSHTYPERFWPKFANQTSVDDPEMFPPRTHPNKGIRYAYGDLQDVVKQLKWRPFSRQAYLPIFFPEDTGAPLFQRVPCSLGYHFIRNGKFLDVNYFIRSCDMTRHFRNDLYFTVRLLQWVLSKVENEMGFPMIGQVTMFISNLHIFEGDRWRYEQ